MTPLSELSDLQLHELQLLIQQPSIPMDSPLRSYSMELFGEATALSMTVRMALVLLPIISERMLKNNESNS